MDKNTKNSKLAFYARVGLVLHAFLLTLLILYLGKVLFIPLFFALLVAILLYPLTRILEKKIKKSLAAILPVVLFLVFIISIIFFFTRELGLFLKDLPKAQSKFEDLVQGVQSWVAQKFSVDD